MTAGRRSIDFFSRAERVIPGGVNSPVRAFRSVDGQPLFIDRGEGPFIFDADGRRYIDYVLSWGPLILGHRSAPVLKALNQALNSGTSFGAPTEAEVELAELLSSVVPGLQMVRLVNSGTEATMSAVRLARAYTNRDFIIKFNGCYHGHNDSLLVAAGSGAATFGVAGSAGVLKQVAETTVSVEFNDIATLRASVELIGAEQVAAVIIEPVPGNMGLVLPRDGFLKQVRDLCTQHGILLIFDEVMSGFRVALGGAQERFAVNADLITLGKVIGGGLPAAAFGGRSEIMQLLSPLGPVYQAGTLSGNPLAVAAGLETLKILIASNPYPELERLGTLWARGLNRSAAQFGIPFNAASCCSMLGFFFSGKPVGSYAEARLSDQVLFKRFFWKMLERGIYLAPSAFEAGFLSTVHSEELIRQTLESAHQCFAEL